MNKKEFLSYLAETGNFKAEVAAGVFKIFIETWKMALLSSNDSKVNFPEIGKFEVRTKKSRKGTNPKTGKPLVIQEKRTVRFKPSKKLLDALNNSK